MKKQLQKFFAKKKNNKGFTLIELIIVIAILAILVGIVGMASIRYVEKSRKSADEQTLDSISTAAQAAIIDPDHDITVDDGAILTAKPEGEVEATSGWNYNGDYKKDNFEKDIKGDLAKTPKLNSQFYEKGATLKFKVESSGSIKVDEAGWQRVK